MPSINPQGAEGFTGATGSTGQLTTGPAMTPGMTGRMPPQPGQPQQQGLRPPMPPQPMAQPQPMQQPQQPQMGGSSMEQQMALISMLRGGQ